MLVTGMALLVTFPMGQAILSCAAALMTTGPSDWLTALADVLTALVSLFCSIAVLVLLGEDRERRMPRIPLYDWRIAIGRRRIEASHGVDPGARLTRRYEYWTNG
jgi:hypothetical protein